MYVILCDKKIQAAMKRKRQRDMLDVSRLACWMALVALSLCHVTLRASTEFLIEQLTTVDGLANNTVRCILQDSKGRMWFATSNGVSIYEKGTFRNLSVSHDRTERGLCDQRTRALHEDRRGYVWIGSVGGVDGYDMRRERLVDFRKTGVNPSPFPKAKPVKIRDGKGRTWQVTEHDGLYITDANGKKEHFTTTSPNNPLPTNDLKCVYRDRDGVIWIGTDNLGVSKITVTHNEGAEYRDEGENVRMLAWLGSDVAAANRHGDLWTCDSVLRHEMSRRTYGHNVYCVMRDARGNVWRGTKGGGLYCGTRRIPNLPHREIYSLWQESDSCVWIATFGGGLVAYDPLRHEVGTVLLTMTDGSRHVRKLAMDSGKRLWVATSDGVFVVKGEGGARGSARIVTHLSVKNGQMRSDEVRTVFVDSKGRVYMAEAGSGFAVWEKGKLTHYTKADSLVNDMVQCFVEDRQGFIWMSTELGVSRFNPTTKKIANFFFSKNMLNNVFNENSGVLLADGTVAFGSANGIVVITPSVYNVGESTTAISANDVTVDGRPVRQTIVYMVEYWWKSPWAVALLSLLVIGGVLSYHYNRSRNMLFRERISKLKERADLLSTDIQCKSAEGQDASEKAFAERAKAIVEESMSDSDFNVDAFASRMGMGRTTFFQKMKQATGYSPKEYINRKRVHHAAYLIMTTSLTISEVAMSVGFSDPLYFSRVFKGEYKCSPKEWRARESQKD